MCGIAGYSLHSRSDLERTLAAQALLAAIAERGAEAAGDAARDGGRRLQLEESARLVRKKTVRVANKRVASAVLIPRIR